MREGVLQSCNMQGVTRRGTRGLRYNGGETGADVTANMRRDGWTWQPASRDMVRGTGLRRAEGVMLNALRRVLSTVAAIKADLGKWSGADSLPHMVPQPRINLFSGRGGPRGPPTGLREYDDRGPPQVRPTLHLAAGTPFHDPDLTHPHSTAAVRARSLKPDTLLCVVCVTMGVRTRHLSHCLPSCRGIYTRLRPSAEPGTARPPQARSTVTAPPWAARPSTAWTAR